MIFEVILIVTLFGGAQLSTTVEDLQFPSQAVCLATAESVAVDMATSFEADGIEYDMIEYDCKRSVYYI